MVGLNGLSRSVALRVGTCLAMAVALIATAHAQEPRYQVDPGIADSETRPNVNPPTATGNQGPGRYDEPPPPPFDFWQPTWMPCQSLRTNRSLVLGHLYWGADILGWASKGVHVPPLVTSGSIAAGGNGVINQGDTVVRFGNSFEENNMRTGGRLTIGWWFDTNQTSGIEWHYFEVDSPTTFRASVADGSSILARPFLNNGAEDAQLTASDTRINSTVVATVGDQLTSTGIVFRKLFWSSEFARFDYAVGYRHVHLADRVRVHESFTTTTGDTDFPDNTPVTRVDQFRTVNQFDGADLGFRGWWSNNGKIAVTSKTSISIGSSSNTALINGYTVEGTGNNRMITNGGVLATPTTAVLRRGHSKFGTVTELGLGLQWQPICNCKFNLGYTWFYWSEVARAASQIDRSGTTNDTFRLHTTSYWADGINGGFLMQF